MNTPTSSPNDALARTIRIVREYRHPRAKVWRALTDPAIMSRWQMQPEGFAPVVGTRFRFVDKPQPRWRGFVECEVLEAREPACLRYTWKGNEGDPPMEVSFLLDETPEGTRLTLEHVGFEGFSEADARELMAVMEPGWRSMLDDRFPPLLGAMDTAA